MNVLLITTDQQRADTIGAYGNPVCRTPNFDRLAREGTRFDACRTQNPYCQPARATILTGTYPSTHGVVSNGIDLDERAVERSVATRFAEAGYRTALFGKAHFASIYPFLPTGKLESVEGSTRMPEGWTGPYFGFEQVELVLFGHMMRMAEVMGRWNWCFGPPPFGLHYARWLFRDGFDKGTERLRLMQPEATGRTFDKTQTWCSLLPEEEHVTTWTADRALGFLDDVRDPFFCWVSFVDPHHPMDAPRPWCDLYSADDVRECLPEKRPDEFDRKPGLHRAWTRGSTGPMSWANPGGANFSDDELCRMIAGYYGMVSQLDCQIGRILDRLDARGLAEDTLVLVTTDHGDFLGDHQMVFKGPLHYEGLLRVPLFARGPGFEAGAVVDDPVGTIDLAPTALAAAGLEVPDYVEGRPLLDGPREWVVTENDHKMVIDFPLRTLTTRRYKITRYLAQDGVGELYDLENDPGEFENLWDDPDRSGLKKDLLLALDEACNAEVNAGPVVGMIG